MYPSNSYVNAATFSENDLNPNLEIQDLTYSSSCLFHFQHFHAKLSQNDLANIGATHEMTVPEITENSSQNNAGMKEHMSAGGSTDQEVVRKNVCKKDRHSKIETVHGPRDRRMRLSLDAARKFFALQDILGYDKASKTVEWLFKQSKPAIKVLTGEFPQKNKGSGVFTLCASPSDCLVVSGIDQSVPETASIKTELPSTRIKKKRVKRVRKATFYPFTKESRRKARERARERTSNKKRQQQLHDQQSTNIMTWSPTGTGEKLAGCSHYTINYNSPTSLDEVEEMQKACEQKMNISQGTREESINVSDPNALFNYHHDSYNSHEFADFQFYGYHN